MAPTTGALRTAAAYAVAIGIAVGGIVGPRLYAQAGPFVQETGQFSSAGTIVWLRVANDGSVLVYAARGFRSAFAHPSTLSAQETDRWATAAAAFVTIDSAAQADRDPSYSRLHTGDTLAVRAVLADGDLTVEPAMIGQALSLVVHFGARGPAPVTAIFPSIALGNVISILRRTADVARETERAHAAAVAEAAAKAAKAAAAAQPPAGPEGPSLAAPPPSSPAAATPGGSSSATPQATPSPAASTDISSTTGLAARAVPAPVSAPQALAASSAPVPGRAAASAPPPAPPTLTPSSPAARPAQPASGPASGTGASAQIGHVVNAPDSRIDYAAPPPSAEPQPPAGPRDGGLTNGGAPVRATSTGSQPAASGEPPGAGSDSAAAGDSVAEKALNTNGRLAPSVLGDIIRQRQQLLQYCYTEFGLRSDPALAGQIIVRLVIEQAGVVSAVTIPQHSWSGRGAERVEACIRQRILEWQFPAAERASTHEIQLIFGR